MDGLIETLSRFTSGVKNLSNIIPDVLNSTHELSTKLSQLSPDALKNLHKPENNLKTTYPATEESTLDETSDSLDQIKLAVNRSESYEKRSGIYYSGTVPEIGEAYQFNHGIFKDNLNCSYKQFISAIEKDFTAKDKYSSRLQDQVIPRIKETFTSWLANFNSAHDSINGAIPIENIQEKYSIPFQLMSPKAVQDIKDQESKAAKNSLIWLNLANESSNLLSTINKINTNDPPYDAATLNPHATYKIGELKKFLLTELEEKFNPVNIEKLLRHCKKHQKTLDLDKDALERLTSLQEWIKDFKSDNYKHSVSKLDIKEGLTINARNIDYIEGFFTQETEKREKIDTQYLSTMLNSVHQSYTENYPREGYQGETERNKIASQILNITLLLTNQELAKKEKDFLDSLQNFYMIEKENTKSL